MYSLILQLEALMLPIINVWREQGVHLLLTYLLEIL